MKKDCKGKQEIVTEIFLKNKKIKKDENERNR